MEDNQFLFKDFDNRKQWEKEWEDMPEFLQEDQSPFKEIVVKLRNKEDMIEFMDIVKQKFTMKTKSIWYPILEIKKISHLRYKDKNES